MIISGFRFGLLLQIAVGPICFFIFQTSINSGFSRAFSGVLGVTFVDALYIFAAIFGIGKFIENNRQLKYILSYFGTFVVILFGLNISLSTFGYSFMPELNLTASLDSNLIFLKALILTLANPLTILFWAGVFSSKIIEEKLNKNEVYLFAFGAILSTFIFLTLISYSGSFANSLFNRNTIKILNFFVGVILVFFGLKNIKKQT